jgi:hypothetical protein
MTMDELVAQIKDGRLPLFACDELLWKALQKLCSDSQFRDELSTLFFSEGCPNQARALFQYLFLPPGLIKDETGYHTTGFRLRNAEERLEYKRAPKQPA